MTSRERSAALKAAARLLGRVSGPIGAIIEVGSWAYKYSPLVEAYNDPPKSLDELQQAVSTTALGYVFIILWSEVRLVLINTQPI